MSKISISEFFIQALAELRDEQREENKAQLRLNIRACVNRLVQDFRTEFTASLGHADLLPARRRHRHPPEQHSSK